jgi:hypothetical protein
VLASCAKRCLWPPLDRCLKRQPGGRTSIVIVEHMNTLWLDVVDVAGPKSPTCLRTQAAKYPLLPAEAGCHRVKSHSWYL